MKNALLNAAMYMAVPYGIRINAWKLAEKLGDSIPTMIEHIKPYAQVLVDMYEIAEEVAMGDAEDLYEPFGIFGNWFSSFIREHERLPKEMEAIQAASDCIFNVFIRQITRDQQAILRRRLDVEVKEYSDE